MPGRLRCVISNYGARILELHLPDRDGNLADIVLGFDRLEDYLLDSKSFFGACVGRVANRISHAAFHINGERYDLPANEGPHHLHGGPGGFHQALWQCAGHSPRQLSLRMVSPDGDQGYPGRMEVQVDYSLTEEGDLRMDYEASSDRPCPVNLTNHSYFNLDGQGAACIADHVLEMQASHYCPIQADFIPTGEVLPVDGGPFDFRLPAVLKSRLSLEHPQLALARGFDHHCIVAGEGMRAFAKMYSPHSGRSLEVWSDAHGMQFYSGNFLDGTIKGKGESYYGFRSAFCFETQGYPNAVNTPSFPMQIAGPGQPYRSSTVFKFAHEPAS